MTRRTKTPVKLVIIGLAVGAAVVLFAHHPAAKATVIYILRRL